MFLGRCLCEENCIIGRWMETIEQTHYIEPEITYTESCGCRFSIPIDYREFARSYIVENESRRQFEEKRTAFMSRMILIGKE